jgi:hypothetical protein
MEAAMVNKVAATLPAEDEFSVLGLRAAYHKDGRPNFRSVRDSFEKEHGDIEEEYYARNVDAAVVVVERKPRVLTWLRILRWRHRKYKIKIYYQPAQAGVRLSELVRSALAEGRQSSMLLTTRAQQSMMLSLYTVIAFLLGTLDNGKRRGLRNHQIDEVARSAKEELNKIKKRAQDDARNIALLVYLIGLPFGGFVAFLIIVSLCVSGLSITLDGDTKVTHQLSVCLAFGGIGAMVSVMSRVTKRQRLVVDARRGILMTLALGAFRTIIGAVFGSILFVLAEGGLLPIDTAGSGKEELFFAGLAFIAGFNEQWAQDSIVRSAPIFARKPTKAPQAGNGLAARPGMRTDRPTARRRLWGRVMSRA